MEIENSKMIYRGSNELARVYRGETIVWEPYTDPRSTEYLTSVILSGGTITSPYQEGLYYRKNGGEWTAGWHIEGAFEYGLDLPVSTGDTVEFKRVTSGHTTISHNSVVFNARGNVMSLLYGDDFVGKRKLTGFGALGQQFYRQYWEMNVIDASDLILPARYLSAECYKMMFLDCALLTAAPALPAPLNSGGTGVGSYAYQGMFMGCTSLRTAPDIPASVARLSNACDDMFSGSSVNYVKCLAVFNDRQWNATYPFHNWLSGVPDEGTFIKSPDMEDGEHETDYYWVRNENGIPVTWHSVDG